MEGRKQGGREGNEEVREQGSSQSVVFGVLLDVFDVLLVRVLGRLVAGLQQPPHVVVLLWNGGKHNRLDGDGGGQGTGCILQQEKDHFGGGGGCEYARLPINCISHSRTLSIWTALRSDRSSYSSLRAPFSRQKVARPRDASRPAKIPYGPSEGAQSTRHKSASQHEVKRDIKFGCTVSSLDCFRMGVTPFGHFKGHTLWGSDLTQFSVPLPSH